MITWLYVLAIDVNASAIPGTIAMVGSTSTYRAKNWAKTVFGSGTTFATS
ncbi:MAG TPA: hypothetical protein VEA18_01110 [Candidatus Kapabacteria bacterium]|nr:hypothetical protein [Candidatus Kapabacteria bacterium]